MLMAIDYLACQIPQDLSWSLGNILTFYVNFVKDRKFSNVLASQCGIQGHDTRTQ